jgi:LasA protease
MCVVCKGPEPVHPEWTPLIGSLLTFVSLYLLKLRRVLAPIVSNFITSWRNNRHRIHNGWLTSIVLGVSILVPFSYNQETVLAQSFAVETDVLPKEAFVLSSESFDFETQQFLVKQSGVLNNHTVNVGGKDYTAADIIHNYAGGHSLSRKMLLAYLETQYGWVSKPVSKSVLDKLVSNSGTTGFEPHIMWLTTQLSQAFYSYNPAQSNYYTFRDGSKIAVPGGTTAVTYAIFSTLASTSATLADWQSYVGADGYKKVYRVLFGEVVIPQPNNSPQSAIPNLKLPWTAGETWYFTGGPHGEGGNGPPYHAVDFAPPSSANVAENCSTTATEGPKRSTRPLKAPHNSRVIDIGPGPWYYVTLNYNGSDWQVRLTHFAPTGRPARGTSFNPGDTIGYPSNCGQASGVHVHLSTLNNGVLQDINNTVISGWTIKPGNAPYQGRMEKPGQATVYVGGAIVSDNTPQPTTPNAPYQLGATKGGDGKVKLFWGDASDNETGFKIERQTLGTSTWVSIGQTPANETLYETAVVPQGVVYHYRVFAYNAAGNSDFISTRTSPEVPVYRFWNQAAFTPFYTANPDEAHNLRKGSPPGWKYERIAFYAYRADDCNGRSPIHRFVWSGNSAVHFYGVGSSLNPSEWTYQHVAFCAYANPIPNVVAVHILHLKSNANIHYYTTLQSDIDDLTVNGVWQYEGVAFSARSAPPQYEVGQASPFANRFRGAYNQRALAMNFPDAADRVNEYATSGVEWQPLTGALNAALFHHGAANAPGEDLVRAFIVEGAIKQAYFDLNGPLSWLGPLTSDQYTNAAGKFQNSFGNGYIVVDNNVAQAVPWPTSFVGYKTSYFNNVHLWSGPTLVRNEGDASTLNFSYDWGTLTPPLPQHGLTFPDSWSVRWERNWQFTPGTYKFRLCGDDGLRLYLDNVKVIEQWVEQSQVCLEYNKTYSSTKTEPVKVEYFQGYGGANISFNVSQLNTLTVVEPVDTGDVTAVGTLSYALQNGNMVLFNVPGANISVRGNLPVVRQGVRVMGDCTNPITIDGSHPSASADGFKLGGNNMLQGLKLVGFRGKLLDFNGTLGNTLNCMTIKR